MATTRRNVATAGQVEPIWPTPLPHSGELRVLYGVEADELVVLFANVSQAAGVVEFIATPDADYAALKVHPRTGEVLGAVIYPLAAVAIWRHPDWAAALDANPAPETAERIVADIKRLHDRYGLTQECAA